MKRQLSTVVLIQALFAMFCIKETAHAQNANNELSNIDEIVELLDGNVYEVPGYGSIRFSFNKIDFKLVNAERDKESMNCLTDRERAATFDVNVRRLGEKRFERVDHKLELDYPEKGKYEHSDPNRVYYHGFQFIQIEEFPCSYFILGNGELYVELTEYEKKTFEEIKMRLLGIADEDFHFTPGSNLSSYFVTRTYWTECPLLERED